MQKFRQPRHEKALNYKGGGRRIIVLLLEMRQKAKSHPHPGLGSGKN